MASFSEKGDRVRNPVPGRVDPRHPLREAVALSARADGEGRPSPTVPSFTWDFVRSFLDARILGSSRVDGVPTKIVAFFGDGGRRLARAKPQVTMVIRVFDPYRIERERTGPRRSDAACRTAVPLTQGTKSSGAIRSGGMTV